MSPEPVFPEILPRKHVEILREKGFGTIPESVVEAMPYAIKIFLKPKREEHLRIMENQAISPTELLESIEKSLKSLEFRMSSSSEETRESFERAKDAVESMLSAFKGTEDAGVDLKSIGLVVNFWKNYARDPKNQHPDATTAENSTEALEKMIRDVREKLLETGVGEGGSIQGLENFVLILELREITYRMKLLDEWREKLRKQMRSYMQ